MKTFTPVYVKHYALALIHQLKLEKVKKASQLLLQKPPTPSEPLQTGVLVKQGAIAKNWKSRYFVGAFDASAPGMSLGGCRLSNPPSLPALNEKHNYEVRYYTDEAAYKANPDKPKGSMHLCWFRIERCVHDHCRGVG